MIDGYAFASKLEANVYQMLKLKQEAGEIGELRCQSRVYLTDARIAYIPDFEAIDLVTGRHVYWEAKGVETATWRIKRRLWLHYGPGRLEVWKRRGQDRLYLHEVLEPK